MHSICVCGGVLGLCQCLALEAEKAHIYYIEEDFTASVVVTKVVAVVAVSAIFSKVSTEEWPLWSSRASLLE